MSIYCCIGMVLHECSLLLVIFQSYEEVDLTIFASIPVVSIAELTSELFILPFWKCFSIILYIIQDF